MAREKARPPKRSASPSRPAARPTVSEHGGDEAGAARVARRVSEGLRRFRKARGLSLDELAQRSGVSRAALSQIEGARTNPTLAVLWKVAVGLEVPFQALIGATEEKTPQLVRASESAPLRSADGRMESRLLSPRGTASDLEIYELKFLPKGVHRSEPHSEGTTEILTVTVGTLRVTIDEQVYELGAGDTLFFHADVPHVYENKSTHESRSIDLIRYAREN